MRERLRVAKPTWIALIVVWTITALFVLSNLSEDARGDSYLVRLILEDFAVGAALTALILVCDRLIRRFVRTP